MTGLGAFFLKEASVFDGDAGFAGQNAKEFQMALIKNTFLVRVNAEDSDGLVVGDERNAAEGAAGANGFDTEFAGLAHVIIANEHGLTSAQNIFGDVIAGGARALRLAHPVNHFEFELNGISQQIGRGDIKILHVEEAAKFFPDFSEQFLAIESGTEGAANFVEDVEFFGATGSLLNQVAVFHAHPVLMAKGEKQTKLGGSETAIVRGAQQQQTESLFLGLQADDHHTAQAVAESEFAEAADGLIFFERAEIVVAQIAESEKTAEAGNQADQIVVETFFLGDAAKIIGNTGGDD